MYGTHLIMCELSSESAGTGLGERLHCLDLINDQYDVYYPYFQENR